MTDLIPKNSLELMQRNSEIRTQYGDDSFFLTARNFTWADSGRLEIHIDDTCPVLVRDAKLRAAINAPENMMTLKEGRSEIMADMGYIALAAGGFVWVGEKMAMLERDYKAPLLAEHWTNPSGMCGEHPFETADKETCEELKLYDLRRRILIAFQRAGKPATETAQAVKNLKSNGTIAEGENTEIQFIDLGAGDCERQISGRSVTIVIGNDKQTREIPHIHVDRDSNNVVALNQVFFLSSIGGQNDNMIAVDGEEFNREGGIFSVNAAQKLKLVPTTRDYLERLSPNF
jgi:hypothetical protein